MDVRNVLSYIRQESHFITGPLRHWYIYTHPPTRVSLLIDGHTIHHNSYTSIIHMYIHILCWWCPANTGVLIRRCLPWPVPLDLLPSVLTSPPGEIYWRTYTIVPKPMTILGERHTVVVWCATHANRVSLQLVYSKD